MSRLLVFLTLFAALTLPVFSQDAQAEEQLLNLWPTQRTLHQHEMEMQADKYQRRGQEYVDSLYKNQGEAILPDPTYIHDDYELYPVVNPVEVNVDQVTDIIKQQSQN